MLSSRNHFTTASTLSPGPAFLYCYDCYDMTSMIDWTGYDSYEGLGRKNERNDVIFTYSQWRFQLETYWNVGVNCGCEERAEFTAIFCRRFIHVYVH